MFAVMAAPILLAHHVNAQAQQCSVFLDPLSYTATQLNETFSVNITISNVQNLWGWGANVSWDPRYLNLLSKHEGDFIENQVDSTMFSATKVGDNVVLFMDACSSSGNEEEQSASGSGVLATMQFQVIKQTLSTSILLSDINLQGPNPNNATIGTPHPIITPASDSATTMVSLVIVGPPTADAGEDQTVPVGTQVVLNASKSISTGTGTTYTWTFTDITQQTLTGMIANYTFNNPGTYNITLTVRDSLGSDNSYVTVTVEGATTIVVTTSTGASINLTISGSITSSQMSNVMVTTSQSANTTTISFTVTGQNGKNGFGNITVPRSAITYGITPTTFIDGQAAQEQGYSEDSNNYYVWYTTDFSSHSISIVFSTVSLTLATPTTTNSTVQSFSLPPTILGILVILTIFVLGGSLLWLRKRTNKI
jgi:hypothetical protein